MNIEIVNIILAILVTIVLVYMCNIVDRRDKEINGTYSGYRPSVFKVATKITEVVVYCLVAGLTWFTLSILTLIYVQTSYEKDKTLGSEYKSEYIDTIKFEENGYLLNEKYRMTKFDRVHIVEAAKPYITYPQRIDFGPFYYRQDNLISNIPEVELYISKDIADKAEKLKEESIVYTSNK